MCRLAAFPPGTTADIAHEIVNKFVGNNNDGVGVVFTKSGEFKVHKYPISYRQAVAEKKVLFDHMPYEGWTLAHVRLATHGENEYKNTHPIIRGNIAVVHNGIFSQSELVRAALADSVKWSGETDTEVAAYMLNKLGPSKFLQTMDNLYAGVYLALSRDGSLVAVKTSGDLELARTPDDKFILASEFPWFQQYAKRREAGKGILRFDKEGHALNFKFEKELTEKKDYYSRYERRPNCQMATGGYTSNDIGFASMKPTSGTHTPTQAPPSTVPLIGKPKKKMDLWEWPTDEELNKMELE